MLLIIRSCLGQKDLEYYELLEQLYIESESLLGKGLSILQEGEKVIIDFMLSVYKETSMFPSVGIIEDNHPEYKGAIDITLKSLTLDDLPSYIGLVINDRVKKETYRLTNKYTEDILDSGISESFIERLEELKSLSSKNNKDVSITIDFKKVYEEKLTKNIGLVTGIPEIDEKIGGLSEGTLTTIAGFTSHFKTTFALNIAYLNAYHYGYNIVYISLETPKEDMYFNLLCRHSYEPKFTEFMVIPHEKIRRCELTEQERDYLYNVVEPDLHSPMIGEDGKEFERGKVIILDEGDFPSMSFTDLRTTLEEIDDKLNGHLDGVFVDYIQLCKFAEHSKGMDDNRIINSYVTFFRRLTQKFRFGKKKKRLIGVLLSQISREPWKRASKKNGVYDLTCLADANELERGSYRVITTYTTEVLKGIKTAQLQILKNRGGATLWEPITVFADGEAYVFGEEGGTDVGNVYSGSTASTILGDSFSQIKDDFLGMF